MKEKIESAFYMIWLTIITLAGGTSVGLFARDILNSIADLSISKADAENWGRLVAVVIMLFFMKWTDSFFQNKRENEYLAKDLEKWQHMYIECAKEYQELIDKVSEENDLH